MCRLIVSLPHLVFCSSRFYPSFLHFLRGFMVSPRLRLCVLVHIRWSVVLISHISERAQGMGVYRHEAAVVNVGSARDGGSAEQFRHWRPLRHFPDLGDRSGRAKAAASLSLSSFCTATTSSSTSLCCSVRCLVRPRPCLAGKLSVKDPTSSTHVSTQ